MISRMLVPVWIVIFACSTRGVRAEDVTPEVELAVQRGLSFLAQHQRADGAIVDDGPAAATTALAVMAYLSAGHVPDLGRHGPTVASAVEYLLANIPDDAYIGKVDGSRMYGQGIVALALAEVSGVDANPARKQRLTTAVERMARVILDAQAVEKEDFYAGGWRYEPQSVDSDLSLSGWNALAMRASVDVGISVPKEHVDRAAGFIIRCYRPTDQGFAYQPGSRATGSMTGVGVLALSVLDNVARPEARDCGQLLMQSVERPDERYPFYALYYQVQAANQLGEAVWATAWPIARDRLLTTQQEDGGWPQSTSQEEPGRVYATGISLLALTVPYRLLPIYQR